MGLSWCAEWEISITGKLFAFLVFKIEFLHLMAKLPLRCRHRSALHLPLSLYPSIWRINLG